MTWIVIGLIIWLAILTSWVSLLRARLIKVAVYLDDNLERISAETAELSSKIEGTDYRTKDYDADRDYVADLTTKIMDLEVAVQELRRRVGS